jgi:hypothetical protein
MQFFRSHLEWSMLLYCLSFYLSVSFQFRSCWFEQLSPCTGLMGRIYANLMQWAQHKYTASAKVILTPTMETQRFLLGSHKFYPRVHLL